jgi:GNAT superfamily N-acetyltransferase
VTVVITRDMADGVVIHRWLGLADRAALLPGLDVVFFESSATKSFDNDAARRAFRERWLGRYLATYPEWVYVGLAADGTVVGYLCGSLDDPATTPLFSDLSYFQDFAQATRAFPAQLHVNLLPDWRSFGIGARLVQIFAADAAKAGAPGVHVVTTRGMRNVRYYAQNGFREVASTRWNGRQLLLLGRELGRAEGVPSDRATP